MKIKDQYIRLTKIKSIQFGDNHPNGINIGYVKEGIAVCDVEVGSFLIVACNYKQMYTSMIMKINDDQTFETENSVYQVEILPQMFNKRPVVGEKYDHYKGGYYEVLGIGKHTTTNEECVFYTSLKHGSFHIRPITEWFEIVANGETRFKIATK